MIWVRCVDDAVRLEGEGKCYVTDAKDITDKLEGRMGESKAKSKRKAFEAF